MIMETLAVDSVQMIADSLRDIVETVVANNPKLKSMLDWTHISVYTIVGHILNKFWGKTIISKLPKHKSLTCIVLSLIMGLIFGTPQDSLIASTAVGTAMYGFAGEDVINGAVKGISKLFEKKKQ